ncbi:MAG: hypothetical protein ACI9LM_003365 [Alteromonadaceae bacterium]|jgi:hypothetical protein
MTANSKLIITFIILLSAYFQVNAAEKPVITVMDDARIFAQFDQEVPAVVSYFTKNTELDIISFYSDFYGKPLNNKTKKKYLALTFVDNQHNIRIIISQQDNLRQVDILVTLVNNLSLSSLH